MNRPTQTSMAPHGSLTRTYGRIGAACRSAIVFAALSFGLSASAATVELKNDLAGVNSPGCSSGVCIAAAGLDSTQYTGWIYVAGYTKATLGVTFVDANDSVTLLNVLCWTDYVASTANGSGFEICSGSTLAGTTTVTCPHTWSLTTGTAEQYTMTIDNLNAEYLNCSFAGTGAAAAADTVTVKVLRRVP